MKRRVLLQSLGMVAILAGFALLTSVSAAIPTFYVATTGTDSASCGTSSNKCRTIAYTLDKRVTGPAVIQIAAGTYYENLDISKEVTLKGAGAATTIIAGNDYTPKPPIINVTGVRLTLYGLTLKGGDPGLMAVRAFVSAEKCNFNGNTDGLVGALNSSLHLLSCNFKSNSGDGLGIELNSAGYLESCVASGNGIHGVQIRQTSSGHLRNCTVSGNTQNGVAVGANSSGKFQGNLIYGNKRIGLIVHKQSAGDLRGGNKIYSNGQALGGDAGLAVYNASHVYFSKGSTRDLIYNNKGPGINVAFNGNLYMEGSSATVNANQGHGVLLGADSGAQFDGGVVITKNTGVGILCVDGPGDSKYSGSPTVTDNTAGQISCSRYW